MFITFVDRNEKTTDFCRETFEFLLPDQVNSVWDEVENKLICHSILKSCYFLQPRSVEIMIISSNWLIPFVIQKS